VFVQMWPYASKVPIQLGGLHTQLITHPESRCKCYFFTPSNDLRIEAPNSGLRVMRPMRARRFLRNTR